MFKKRIWILVTLAIMLAMIVSACAVPVPPPPAAGAPATAAPAAGSSEAVTDTTASTEAGPATLTWAMWGSPEEVATHQKVADIFMSDHPDIKIEIMSAPWADYFTKIQT